MAEMSLTTWSWCAQEGAWLIEYTSGAPGAASDSDMMVFDPAFAERHAAARRAAGLAPFISRDQRNALKLTKQPPFLDRTKLGGAEAVERMADDMRVMHANAGAVTADDLCVLGWQRRQVETHGAKARESAFAQSAG